MNLTLPKLNSEGIALLCQWLPTSKVEVGTSSVTLTLISSRVINYFGTAENSLTTSYKYQVYQQTEDALSDGISENESDSEDEGEQCGGWEVRREVWRVGGMRDEEGGVGGEEGGVRGEEGTEE